MNLATNDKNWKIVKWKHLDNIYKYLSQITETMFYVTVMDNDDETLLYAANWLSLKDATRDFNRIRRMEDLNE